MTACLVLHVRRAGAHGRWPLTDVVRLLHAPVRALSRAWAELRIDVDLPEEELEQELAQLYERWFMSGASMDDLDGIRAPRPGLVFKARQADGEWFIYVVDTVRRALAAYVVFSRLVEVNRQADKQLRSPHAKVARAYRRLGITSTIYRWWLDGGRNLMSGERQSQHAHQMWMALAHDYALVHVRLQDKQVQQIDAEPCASVLHELGTRMVLLGRGCAMGAWAVPAAMAVDVSRASPCCLGAAAEARMPASARERGQGTGG
jgi:hypothetical protein